MKNVTSEFLFDKFRIYDVDGYTKVRLGNKGDGGYVVLDELCRKSKVLYSYGVDNDMSFEKDWHVRYPHTKIRLFDHTVDRIDTDDPTFVFKKEGACYAINGELPAKSVKRHLEENGEDYDFRKTLKFDIEWCEWSVFDINGESIPILPLFDQVICEFHFLPILYKDSHSPYFTELNKLVYWNANAHIFERYQQTIWSFFNRFTPYHVHINNSLPLINVDGFIMPQLVEVSMINNNLVKGKKLSVGPFPDPTLDFPNKTDRPDILNFKWDWNYE